MSAIAAETVPGGKGGPIYDEHAEMRAFTGLHHAALTVSDLATSADWYRTVLGLEEVFREEGDQRQAVIFRFPGGGHAVGLVGHGRDSTAFDPTAIGLDHLAFSVATRSDLEAWAEWLDELGVSNSGVIEVPPGGILNFKDPDGIALAVFWDRPD